MFKSDLNGKLTIDWANLLAKKHDSVNIEGSRVEVEKAVYVVASIYEFDDENGNADMSKIVQNSTYFERYETKDLVWSKFSEYSNALGVLEGEKTFLGYKKAYLLFKTLRNLCIVFTLF